MLNASEVVEFYKRADVSHDSALLQQAIYARDAARRVLQIRHRIDQGDCPWALGTPLEDYFDHSCRALPLAASLASARADVLCRGGPAVERAAPAVADVQSLPLGWPGPALVQQWLTAVQEHLQLVRLSLGLPAAPSSAAQPHSQADAVADVSGAPTAHADTEASAASSIGN